MLQTNKTKCTHCKASGHTSAPYLY